MAEVEGLWVVYFSSNLEMSGTGVLILEHDKRLLGGDIGYYYIGKYESTGSDITAELDVIRYEPSSISVFGNLGNFHLSLKGQFSGNKFTAEGSNPNIPGLKINVIGEKKV
jgi:hypothetical protein